MYAKKKKKKKNGMESFHGDGNSSSHQIYQFTQTQRSVRPNINDTQSQEIKSQKKNLLFESIKIMKRKSSVATDGKCDGDEIKRANR